MKILRKHRMIPSMSRRADPYDNAQLRKLHEDAQTGGDYANDYRDVEHLLGNIEAFIEPYYNRCGSTSLSATPHGPACLSRVAS